MRKDSLSGWPPAPVTEVFSRLFQAHGPQGWWPGDGAFEIMVGAVLTQNTAWTNVVQAIANLRRAGRLSPEAIHATKDPELAELLRPSGYFNLKAQRLRALCEFLLGSGGIEALAERPTASLRADLLRVKGIGPETADDILLYALERPVFVIDTYTRRLLSRLGMIRGDEAYEDLRAAVEAVFPGETQRLNEFHALIVHHAKVHCRRQPACVGCPLAVGCVLFLSGAGDLPAAIVAESLLIGGR